MRTCTHTRGRRVPEAAVHRFSSVFPQNRLFVDSMRTRRVLGDGGAESTTEERSRAPPTVPFVRSFINLFARLAARALFLFLPLLLFFFFAHVSRTMSRSLIRYRSQPRLHSELHHCRRLHRGLAATLVEFASVLGR